MSERVARSVMTSIILRRSLFLFSLAVCAFSQGQTDSLKGSYDMDCEGYTFHLGGKGTAAKDELTLRLHWRGGLYPPAWESAGWNDIAAKRCSSKSGECEDATTAQLKFDKIGKRLVGGFKVQFENERQEGKFNVKYHHIGPRMICE
jgi:hypothetical protein